ARSWRPPPSPHPAQTRCNRKAASPTRRPTRPRAIRAASAVDAAKQANEAGKSSVLLVAGFRLWRDALVLFAPGRRLDRPLALVGSDGRAIADRRRARRRIGRIRGRQGSRGCAAATLRGRRNEEQQ